MSVLRKLAKDEARESQAKTARELGLEIIGPAEATDDRATRLRAIPAVGRDTSSYAPQGGQHESGAGEWDEARQIHTLIVPQATHPRNGNTWRQTRKAA